MQEKGILQGNLTKALLRMAVPLFVLNLVNSLYNIIDTFWVGQLGELQVGAVSLVGPIMWCAQSVAMGLSAAAIALLSTRLGANQKGDACRFATALLYFAIGFAIVLSIGTLLLLHPILSWLDTPKEIYDASYQYLLGISFDYIGLLMLNLYMAMRQSAGDSRSGVKLNMCASLLNAILDPIFIFVFHFGILGAAIATVVSKLVMAPVAWRRLHDKAFPVHIDFRAYPFHAADGKIILKLCIPAASGQFLENLGFVIMNKYIVYYGAVAISAYGVGAKMVTLAYIPVMSIGAVLATFVGQNLGSGNTERARKAFHTAMKLSTLFSSTLTIIGMLVITPFIHLFVPNASTRLMELTQEYAFFALLCGVFMGWYINLNDGVFNGSGHTNYTFILSMMRLWAFRIPMILLFHRFTSLGITGIWLAMLLSNIFECILAQAIYLRHRWEHSAILTETEKIQPSEETVKEI
ncbi:MATE family efflux transporter [[Clostridium] innocuum]|nr:MATE family efflux transporter [[Clostridium] innocuum]